MTSRIDFDIRVKSHQIFDKKVARKFWNSNEIKARAHNVRLNCFSITVLLFHEAFKVFKSWFFS